jgi:hypothetical protein
MSLAHILASNVQPLGPYPILDINVNNVGGGGTGNVLVQNSNPSVTVNNNGHNSNRATFSLNGDITIGNYPFAIQQDGNGLAEIKNYTGSNILVTTVDSGNITLNPSGNGFAQLTGGNYTSPTAPFPTLGLLIDSSNNIFVGGTEGKSTQFTPQLQFGGLNVGVVQSTARGCYERINNVVTFSVQIVLTSKGSSVGNASIANLPFTPGATPARLPLQTYSINYYSAITIAAASTTSASTLCGAIGGTQSFMTLFNGGDAGALVNIQDTNFSNNAQICITGVYFVQ